MPSFGLFFGRDASVRGRLRRSGRDRHCAGDGAGFDSDTLSASDRWMKLGSSHATVPGERLAC
jgi:hypothetical protein